MVIDLDTRRVESDLDSEIYISATPRQNASLQEQARDVFSKIGNMLRSQNAHILRERIFTSEKATQDISHIRARAYGDIDDGVAPCILIGKKEMTGPITAVQVHAISSEHRPEMFDVDGSLCGRILRLSGCTYLTLSCVSAPEFHNATEQARAMMEKAESALARFKVNFFSVARTWMWLGHILSWYGEFNQVRNKFFAERGLIGKGRRQSMPASTGIGLSPTDGSSCAMDLVAILEPRNSIQHLQAAGRQRCAFNYGSAFSRASKAITPAGQTIFVSGTASIDASGATTHIDDPLGQINESIKNVRAILKDTQVTDEDVVQAVAYCKTNEVMKIFNDLKGTLAWPCITVICDICRPDLLFEIEATALKPKKSR
jgi:enamine deaminase RidA (YjgF/YER057c/UK114 family)